MSKYVAKRAISFQLKGDILSLSTEANKIKKIDPSTINGTIGVFLNDDGTLNDIKAVKTAMKDNINDYLAYPPVTGPESFKEAILKWTLKDEYNNVLDNYEVPFCATIGGTGALTMSFNIFANAGDTILFPNLMWTNYLLIAHNAGLKSDTYQLIDENNHFNVDSLISKVKQYSSQDNIIVVINDPCENPTGYCLTTQEYDHLFKELDKVCEHQNVTVLFDIAYLDYDDLSNEAHRLFKKVLEGHKFLSIFCYSASKTFGVYGCRVGALFAFCQDKDMAKEIKQGMGAIARGTYSCPNGAVCNSIANMLLNPLVVDDAVSNIKANTALLQKRGANARYNLDLNHINYVNYTNGFYVTLIVKNAYDICEKLKEKHMYIVPMDDEHIRICISSITNEEMARLTLELGKIINA
ncbi:MAG: aminotransferase class I/II-fold pyridoxal phosphate-dependent enzyme [Bacilli bacterium]|nr:aminotransferase class I/II-fold pyridoxal phosphate-dependent enzyme [Bacilli bacterium]